MPFPYNVVILNNKELPTYFYFNFYFKTHEVP